MTSSLTQALEGRRFHVSLAGAELGLVPAADPLEPGSLPLYLVVDRELGRPVDTFSAGDVACGLPLEARARVAGRRAQRRAHELELEVALERADRLEGFGPA